VRATVVRHKGSGAGKAMCLRQAGEGTSCRSILKRRSRVGVGGREQAEEINDDR
jgi:hypothetical protein